MPSTGTSSAVARAVTVSADITPSSARCTVRTAIPATSASCSCVSALRTRSRRTLAPAAFWCTTTSYMTCYPLYRHRPAPTTPVTRQFPVRPYPLAFRALYVGWRPVGVEVVLQVQVRSEAPIWAFEEWGGWDSNPGPADYESSRPVPAVRVADLGRYATPRSCSDRFGHVFGMIKVTACPGSGLWSQIHGLGANLVVTRSA